MNQPLRMNVNQTAAAFGVTTMTVWNWRQGSATRTPLPVVVENEHLVRPQVFVEVRAAKAWAKRYGMTFTEPAREDLVVKKVGPKPKARLAQPKPRTAEQIIGARLKTRIGARLQTA